MRNAAADGERNEDGVGYAAYHLGDNVTRLVSGGDIEEDQLIGALAIVDVGLFYGIAGVNQVYEVNALDDTSVLDVETGNNSFGQQGVLPGWLVRRCTNGRS